MHRRSSDRGRQDVGERLRENFLWGVQVLASEQASSGLRWDVRQEEIGSVGVLVEIVAEHHVREFVQNELLSMQRGVSVRVQDEIFVIPHEPDCTQSVLIAEVREFDYPQSTSATALHCSDELIESKGLAQRESIDCPCHGHSAVHCRVTSLRTSVELHLNQCLQARREVPSKPRHRGIC